VVLRRWIPHVLRSYLLVDAWRPEVMQNSGGEYTVHHRNFSLLPPIRAYNEEDSISLAMGFLVDMELQLARFRQRYEARGVRVWEVRSEDLFAPGGVRRLLTLLGLTPNERTLAHVGTRAANPHVVWKAPELLNVSSSWFLARARRYLDEYTARGIPLPHMPAMFDLASCASANLPPPPESQAESASLPMPSGVIVGPLPQLGQDGGALDATLVGNAHGARGSAMLAASLGVPADKDAMCTLPLGDLSPASLATLLDGVPPVPYNRPPVSASVLKANMLQGRLEHQARSSFEKLP